MPLNIKLAIIFLTVSLLGHAKAQPAHDERMLARATPHIGLLKHTVARVWPDAPTSTGVYMAAQIEQESFWNPKAELCVPKPSCAREHGVGLGQFTKTPRMNVFEEVKQMHPDLRGWAWADRHDVGMQLIAISVMNRSLYNRCAPLMSNSWGSFACTMSSYNGGFGGFTADRRLCSNTAGCNPRAWSGNIERTSLKAKTAVQGYGKSFFEINREYVRNVLTVRSAKYRPLFQE